MKHYNFDEVIERRGTNCVKFDAVKERTGGKDLLPLWVADMDFRTPDFIVNALKKRCEHEIFGYTYASDSYYKSIIDWVLYKHNWRIQKEWISYIPGIVKGIGFVLQCFTQPGQSDYPTTRLSSIPSRSRAYAPRSSLQPASIN